MARSERVHKMKPYYEHAGITIYHGDCREVLPQLPKAWCASCSCELADEDILAIHLAGGHAVGPRFDLLLTDPPYGIGEDIRDADDSGRLEWRGNNWDSCIPSQECFDLMMPLCADHAIWGGNYFIERGLTNSRCWLAWYKMQDFSGADMELAWTSFNKSAKVFCLSRVEFHDREKKHHPTQKPLELMTWCLSFAPDSQTVLDPFCGSGTTLRAAKNTRRKAIGIEIEEKYCEIAAKRLSQEVFQFG